MLFPRLWAAPLAEFFGRLDEGSLQRGISYALQGRVMSIDPADSRTILAAVQGSSRRPYGVELRLAERDTEVHSDCTCPVGSDCKHGCAAALILIEALWRFDPLLVAAIRGGLPAKWLKKRTLARVSTATISELAEWGGGDVPEAAPEKSLAKPKGGWVKIGGGGSAPAAISAPKATGKREPKGPAIPWFEAAADARDQAAREAAFARELRRRVKHLSRWETDTFLNNLRSTPNPVDQIARFEELAWPLERSYTRERTLADPAVAEFLRSERAAELSRRFELSRAEDDLLGWLAQAKTERFVASDYIEARWIPARGESGIQALKFEILLTSKKLRREPRHAQQISQLAKDALYRRREFLPEQSRFIQWLESQIRHVSQGETVFGVRDAIGWLGLWSDGGFLLWENDRPVIFNPAPAWIEAARPESGGPPEIVIRTSPLAPPIPLREAGLLSEEPEPPSYGYGVNTARQPRLFIRTGNMIARVETMGTPIRAIAAMKTLPALPLDRIRETGLAEVFVQRLTVMKPVLRALTDREEGRGDALADEIPVEPVVELRLIDEADEFDVVAYARAADGRIFDCAGYARWLPRKSPDALAQASPPPPGGVFDPNLISELADEAAAAPNGNGEAPAGPPPAPEPNPYALLVRPRTADVEPLNGWLLQLIPPGAETGIDAQERTHPWWKATPQAVANFLRLWPLRPKGVKYFGNAALQRLTQPMAAPRFQVKIRSEGMSWFQIDLDWEDELKDLSADEMLKALRTQAEGELVLLPGGRALKRKDLEDLEKKMDAVSALGLEPGRDGQRLHVSQLAGAAGEPLMDFGDEMEELRPLTEKVREAAAAFKGLPEAPVMKGLEKILRPYQRHGVDFLVWAGETFGGALLADEMGLGKTLQTLAALWALREKAGKDAKPSIVLCPASVVHNWQREAKRFFPKLKTLVIERGGARKKELARLEKYHLVVTNYTLARIDSEALRAQEWLMACVDEAQAIKNPKSETAVTVKSLRAQYRFALTGTPIENRLSDLGSIMEFALPGHLAPLGGIERLAAPNPPPRLHKMLRARLRPVLLRRLKAEVAPELPERIEERLDCAMTPSQKVSYLAEVKRARATLANAKDDRVIGPARIQILAALTRLRQICCDPGLVGLPATGSGKVEALVELLGPVLESGHKILVFSQFVRMLDRLQPRLEQEGIRCHYLSGKSVNRHAIVDAFQADPEPCVFLISLKAGGSGLNLTAASHVVLFDPWWNPAVEAQAIDRTHRIGQDKTVIATRLVTEGTIEERILQLQERKRGLMKAVLEEETFNRALTREDFEYLLGSGSEEEEAGVEELV